MKSRSRRVPFISRSPRPRTHLELTLPSLLSPPGKTAPETATGSAWENDLGLGELATALSSDKRYLPFIRRTLAALTTDTEVIAWRQAVLADFLRNPALVERAQALLPRLADMSQGHSLLGQRQRNLLLQTADHLSELDLYTSVVQELHAALDQAALASPALTDVRDNLGRLLADENFQALCCDLPDLRAPLENIASLTIGVNLDVELRPASAVLLAINDAPMGEPASLLERLIGSSPDEEGGLAPLHQVPKDANERMLSPLFQDLDRLLTQVAQPVAQALKRYVKTGSGSLAALEHELAFYVAAVDLIRRLAAQGVTFCQPAIMPVEERVIQIDDLVNLSLALRRENPVASNAEFGADGRIAVLTGPNSGGKTTYLRSLGLAQVLFQAGLFVPASRARISPVDAILTHFPALETRQQGRLAEEAVRLREIFQRCTAHSLVLLNETFSSTASGEALYLAQDILAALRAIGARAIFATHLTELAEHLDDIEASAAGDSRLFSLIAGVKLSDDGQATATFEIKRGKPLGRSYAQQIARRHGISLEQILQARENHRSR